MVEFVYPVIVNTLLYLLVLYLKESELVNIL